MILISDKYRDRSELMATRIVRKNIRKIIVDIPFTNMTPSTAQALILSNVTEDKIKKMYREMYFDIGKPIYLTIGKKLKSVKFFNENLFNELMSLWLQNNAGLNIVSVHSTLVQTILDTITQGYEQNLSVADISRLLQQQGFYRAQSLRIARTETTTITNASTFMAGSSSDLVMDKVWISAQDKRTRRKVFDHLHMNGVKVPYADDFLVSGESLAYPGDITNRDKRTSAGNIINCRCKIALIQRVDEEGFAIRKNNGIIPQKPIVQTFQNDVSINTIGTEKLNFNVKEYALNKAKEFGIKGKIDLEYKPNAKTRGGETKWIKDKNGEYISDNKVSVLGNLTDEQIQKTISHELRHIAQIQSKRYAIKDGFMYWDNEKIVNFKMYNKIINSKTEANFKKYLQLPWELDAHRQGDIFGSLARFGLKSLEGQPTDWLEVPEWEGQISIEDYTLLDLEILNEK